MAESKKYYIATAIAYASGKPHIGNIYEIVLADALARHMRQRGYSVYFQTGTDEHGIKIQARADDAGLSPQAFVDEISTQVRSLYDLMGASYDKFVRTTDPGHKKKVSAIFKKLYDQGDIYKGEYEGMYCEACETFYSESQLVDGKCPDCGADVEYAKEEAYFLRLGKYQAWLEEYIEAHPNFITPVSRKNEMINSFLKPGLEDLCVSRTSFSWGVPVDFDEGHVVYVWIDALSNYITFIGYEPEGASEPAFNEIWPCDVHIIGKDILRFHTIIWPIILKALDIEMPKAIFGHPWLLVGEGKMSKSKGNVIYPDDVVAEYGLDALRYYLLREMPFGSDGTYTDELITERINTELANVYGNLVSRTLAMLEQYFGGVIPEPSETTGEDTELIAALSEAPGIVAAKMDEFKTADALSAIFTVLRRSNKYIDETMPWILAKSDESKGRLATVLYNLADSIRILSSLLSAFMPVSTEKALSALGTHATDWDSLAPGKLESGMKISPAGRLFERIGPSKENKEQPKAASEELISIEDFAKAKIVIGKILTARQHPNAENLLVFTVDIGEESPRQVVSGIAKFYEPESLVGNIVCVAANLKPAKFRGEKSEGMFLMADGEGKPEFLTIRDDSVPVGTIIK